MVVPTVGGQVGRAGASAPGSGDSGVVDLQSVAGSAAVGDTTSVAGHHVAPDPSGYRLAGCAEPVGGVSGYGGHLDSAGAQDLFDNLRTDSWARHVPPVSPPVTAALVASTVTTAVTPGPSVSP